MAWGIGSRARSSFIRAFQTSSLKNMVASQSLEASKPDGTGGVNRDWLRVAAALLLGAGGVSSAESFGMVWLALSLGRLANIAHDELRHLEATAVKVLGYLQEENDENCHRGTELETDTAFSQGSYPRPLSSRFETLNLLSQGSRALGFTFLQCSAKDNASAPRGSSCLTRHSIADAAARAAPAVVNLTVTFGGRGMFFGQSSGSGSIISPDGTILTNYHVIGEFVRGKSKGKLVVTMQDGRTFEGEVKSYDTLADIAVVKVHCKTPLPTVTLGSSRILRPGEWVVALGSPLHLQNTVTAGIISYVDRKSSELGVRGAARTDYIQTDAAINQGNSGGPLLNLDGEVIGINNMKALAADGVSFAIPIDTVVKVIEQLKKHGRVLRPWLGLKMLNLTGPIVEQLKEKNPNFPNVSEGVLVPQVIAGSPGDRAGFRPADVIVQFGGYPVRSVTEIVDILGDKIGVSFDVVVVRTHERRVTLQVMPEEANPNM